MLAFIHEFILSPLRRIESSPQLTAENPEILKPQKPKGFAKRVLQHQDISSVFELKSNGSSTVLRQTRNACPQPGIWQRFSILNSPREVEL